MKNVGIIISNINKALAFEWLISCLDRSKYNLVVILINPNDSDLEQWLKKQGISAVRVTYRSKKDFFNATWKTLIILKTKKIEIVHCHLFEAGIMGLIAAYLLGIKKRIYTRHYATMNHHYYKKAKFIDQFINTLATHIVAPSLIVKHTLIELENLAPSKIILVHHGFNLDLFSEQEENTIHVLTEKYQTKNYFPVIGVIARYTELKGIQYVIPAFQKVLKDYPQAKLVLANTQGDFKTEIQKLLLQIPSVNYIEIKFENEINQLYHLFDVYVHVPISVDLEAFGQTYVEALAAQVPSVFTLSGVASEFIEDHKNALVVDYKNSDAIYHSIISLLADQDLCKKIATQGKKDVYERFQLPDMIYKIEVIYDQT